MSISLRRHKRRAYAGMGRRFAMFAEPSNVRAIGWGFVKAEDWRKIVAATESRPGEFAWVRWRRWSQHAFLRSY